MVLISNTMNIFRLAGDMSHLTAIVILVAKIFWTGDCSGLSGKSQVLFALVFATRYIDLMTTFVSTYNSIMKVVYIVSSLLTLYLIYFRFNRTYQSNQDTFKFQFLIIIAGGMALLYNHKFTAEVILWTFSIYLEAMAIIPQLYMFHNTKNTSVFPTTYVCLMGMYRGLYIFNWIYRYQTENHYDMIAIGAGTIQTVLYLDFFYIYVRENLGSGKDEMLQPVIV